MKSWLKTELHTHTSDDPADGGTLVVHSARQLIRSAAAQGFEVLAITNHDQLCNSHSLIQYAREQGVLLIPGVEATVRRQHLLLYNFLDYRSDWETLEEISAHKGTDQLVVAPHPFFPGPTSLGSSIHHWARLLDAVEYNHFYLHWLNFNRRGVQFARQLDLPLLGSSDVHHLFQLGRTYARVWAEKTTESVIGAIRNGQVELVTQPVSPFFMARWLGLSALSRIPRLRRTQGFRSRIGIENPQP